MKKDSQFSKFIVTLVLFLNVTFTSVVLYIFLKTSAEPTVLIGCWFAFTTGELWLLATVKKDKIKNNKRDKNNDNEN